MIINNKNYILDNDVYELFQDNWKDNVNQFKSQNTGIIVNNIEKLTEDIILNFIDNTLGNQLNEREIIVDKKFIFSHYNGLTVNPVVDDFKQNFTAQCNLKPDLSYVNIIHRE